MGKGAFIVPQRWVDPTFGRMVEIAFRHLKVTLNDWRRTNPWQARSAQSVRKVGILERKEARAKQQEALSEASVRFTSPLAESASGSMIYSCHVRSRQVLYR